MTYPREDFTKDKADELKAIGEKYKSQYDKFKDAARELETDDDEKRFDERLKKLAKQKPGENDD